MAALTDTQAALLAARTLIANRKHWTKNAAARDKEDRMIVPDSPQARSFCALGALAFACTDGRVRARCIDKLDQAAFDLYEKSIIATNDQLNHKSVMQVFDRALENTVK